MALARESRAPMRADSADIELRKGKWTVEEENYANKIISLFNQGMLPVVAGTTLRTYLSDKLRCDPMRITKKYAGASCIGKQVFQLCDNYYECFQENERELQRLENLFLVRINGKGGGLASKRGGSEVPPVPHQSIYETSNLDPTSSTSTAATLQHPAILLASASKRSYKANRRGSGSKTTDKEHHKEHQLGLNLAMALGGSPQLVSHRHSHSADPRAPPQTPFSPYDAYRSGSDYDDQSGEDDYYENSLDRQSLQQQRGDEQTGDEEGQDDYGYAYDPDCDTESAMGHLQQQQMLRQYQKQHQQPTGSPAATANKNNFYSSFQAGGRRVLSAPNLTELNLSNWKDTDYRPLPADSLKELFSLPLGTPQYASAGSGGIASSNYHNYEQNRQINASLLPEHVYSALGNESGRYAPHTKSSSARSRAGGNNNNNNAAAVMAARAKATILALQRHRQEQQHHPHPHPPPQQQHHAMTERRAVDDFHTKNPFSNSNTASSNNTSKPRMKRSHSAMALVDFEKLAGDDTAAGDLFLQFLSKVSGTSNSNTPRLEPKTEQFPSTTAASHASHIALNVDSKTSTEGCVKEEVTHGKGDVKMTHTAGFDGMNSDSVVGILPRIPAALLPADADLILPSAAVSACAGGTESVNCARPVTVSASEVQNVVNKNADATLTATTTEESLNEDGSMDLS